MKILFVNMQANRRTVRQTDRQIQCLANRLRQSDRDGQEDKRLDKQTYREGIRTRQRHRVTGSSDGMTGNDDRRRLLRPLPYLIKADVVICRLEAPHVKTSVNRRR